MIATVEQTRAELARMLELAPQGEEVVITSSGEPIAKLTAFVPVRPPGISTIPTSPKTSWKRTNWPGTRFDGLSADLGG
jgi:antitoxin (DNA-binding transcriptional repressor) of toxin-antitoxin stability system